MEQSYKFKNVAKFIFENFDAELIGNIKKNNLKVAFLGNCKDIYKFFVKMNINCKYFKLTKKNWKSVITKLKDKNNMPKFDVIVGNPPYEGQGNPLYLQILEVCHKIANKIIWLCPSQWVKVYKEKEYIKNVKKNCPLISHKHISNPFENAGLANEIGIYVFGKSDKYENYDEIKMERFSNPVLAKSIISKFENYTDNLFNHCKQDNNLDFYVNAAQIRGNQDLKTNKPKWDWTTLFGTNQRIDYKKEKGSYIFWNFSTENECKNFIASTETDIFMFSIYVVKNHQKNPYCNYELMPWFGDYTKKWTENEIAKKLKLTKEEVEYIHQEMKNFGWKAKSK